MHDIPIYLNCIPVNQPVIISPVPYREFYSFSVIARLSDIETANWIVVVFGMVHITPHPVYIRDRTLYYSHCGLMYKCWNVAFPRYKKIIQMANSARTQHFPHPFQLIAPIPGF